MLKAIYHTFHHHRLLSVFLLYQMPTKVEQELTGVSGVVKKGGKKREGMPNQYNLKEARYILKSMIMK
jgi:hypothetical protein